MRLDPDEGRLNRLERAVEQVSQQLAALSTVVPRPQPAAGVSDVAGQDTWQETAGPEAHERYSVLAVGQEDTWHETAGTRETTREAL